MKKVTLILIVLFTQYIFCQEDSRMSKNRLIKEAQEQLNKGIAPNNIILVNKSQTMAEADEIDEIRFQLKKNENARALKLKQIADKKEDSIAEATNPTLREIREIAKAEKIKEDQLHKDYITKNAKEYYYDGYTPLDTLITRQLKSGILPCDVNVTCYANFHGTQGDPSSIEEQIMIDNKLAALCRGLKVEQEVPKYMHELEEYELKLLKNHFDKEQNLLFYIEESGHLNYSEKMEHIQKLDSLYKLRPQIFSKAVNLRYRLTNTFKKREIIDIPSLILEIKKNDIEDRYANTKLTEVDYKGIVKMDWDEEKYIASKSKKLFKTKPSALIIYQSIWSIYSSKKIIAMPKYNLEEAESYSTFTYDDNTKILKVETSSPEGVDLTSIKISSINKEGNKTNYIGKTNLSNVIISVNKLSKWIEVTNVIDGKFTFEYHKIN